MKSAIGLHGTRGHTKSSINPGAVDLVSGALTARQDGHLGAGLHYRSGMPLIFHWGGPRHGDVEELPPELLKSSVLVYDGPRWFGVYERFEPLQMQSTPAGPAEVWVVRE